LVAGVDRFLFQNRAKDTCIQQDNVNGDGQANYRLQPCDQLSTLQTFRFLWSDLNLAVGQVQLFGTNLCLDDTDSVPLVGDYVTIAGLAHRGNRNQYWAYNASTGNMRSVFKDSICWE